MGLLEGLGIEGEFAVDCEISALQVEVGGIALGAEEDGAVEGTGKKEMGGGACAGSGELDLKRVESAATSFERRVQRGFAGGRDSKRLEAWETGLIHFGGDDVAVRRKTGRRRLELNDGVFAKLLKAHECLGDEWCRLPADEDGGGWRELRSTIGLPRGINGSFDSPFLQALPAGIDSVGVAVESSGGHAVRGLRFAVQEHDRFLPGPR